MPAVVKPHGPSGVSRPFQPTIGEEESGGTRRSCA
jgi:hypothetical protein